MACVNHAPITYAGKPNAYPAYADGMGLFMVVFAVVWIPIMAIWEYGKRHDFVGVSLFYCDYCQKNHKEATFNEGCQLITKLKGNFDAKQTMD